jgi:hypothetical protein
MPRFPQKLPYRCMPAAGAKRHVAAQAHRDLEGRKTVSVVLMP